MEKRCHSRMMLGQFWLSARTSFVAVTKPSYEDFRNHGHWQDYEVAIEEMVETTSTKQAHWHLVPANNKPFSRLAAFRIIVDRLSKGVALEPPALDPRVAAAAEQFLGIALPPGTRAAC